MLEKGNYVFLFFFFYLYSKEPNIPRLPSINFPYICEKVNEKQKKVFSLLVLEFIAHFYQTLHSSHVKYVHQIPLGPKS